MGWQQDTLKLRSQYRWVLIFCPEMLSVEHLVPPRTVRSRWLSGYPLLFLFWQMLLELRRLRFARKRLGSAWTDRAMDIISIMTALISIETTFNIDKYYLDNRIN